MRHTASTLAVAASLALLAGGASAQATGTTTQGTATTAPAAAAKLSRSDANFIKDAAKAGMAEIEGSKLAAQKATDPKLKSYAQQLVDDHTKAAEELKTLAQAKGVELPKEPSMMQRGKLKALASADGAKFDQRYADSIGVKAHEDAVKLFQKAANSAKDADVKAYAAKTLPTLQQHLQMGREMHASADAAANAGTGSAAGTSMKR